MMVNPLHPLGAPSTFRRTLLLGLIGVMAAAVFIVVWPAGDAKQRFTVLKGASARTIANALKSEGLIGSALLFRVWARLWGSREAMHPGIYMLAPDWTGLRTYRQIRRGPPLLRVTFPEGWTSVQMAELLENKAIVTAAEFLAIVQRDKREGFLFPDTYFFGQGLDAAAVVSRMVRRFHEEEPPDILAQAKVLRLNYNQIVTLASLVEREARVAEERPLIAGVYVHRLRKRMRLEADPTVQYALGKWKSALTYKDLQVESPYNTYRHPGLPPGPICNPGKSSLAAAAHPAQTDMLFFVAEGNGTHIFSKDYQSHLNVQKRKRK